MLENLADTRKLLKLYRSVRQRSQRLSALIHDARVNLGDPPSKERPRSPKAKLPEVDLQNIFELEGRLLEEIIQIEHAYREMRSDLGDPSLMERMGRGPWAEANRLLEEILGYFDRIKEVFRTKIC